MDTSTLVTMVLAVGAPIALIHLAKLGLEALIYSFKRAREAAGMNVRAARERSVQYRQERLAREARQAYEEGAGPDTSAAYDAGYAGREADWPMSDAEHAAYREGWDAGGGDEDARNAALQRELDEERAARWETDDDNYRAYHS